MRALRKPVLNARIFALHERIQVLEQDDGIVFSCITQDSGLCSVRLEASTVGPVDTSISRQSISMEQRYGVTNNNSETAHSDSP